jgi:acetyl esterase/lipase
VNETQPLNPRPDIDPAIKALLDAFPLRFTMEDGVEYAREQLLALKPPPETLPAMRIEERVIGYGDVTNIPVRIYWPPIERNDNLPVVVFYHGGGWAIGDLDVYDGAARAHAVGAEAVVVSVGYRLAPEHPFPAGIDDCWAALRWVGEHAAEFGGDPARIAVAGDSAGGNISAVMTQLARDNDGPRLLFQLLWYPATTIDLTLPSMTENADAPLLNAEVLAAYLHWYLPTGFDSSDHAALPPTLAPANATELSGLPPAYIGIAEYDPLRDDGARYAELLSSSGVPVELHNATTLIHGYMTLAAAVPAAAEATDRGLAALKVALQRT